MRLFFVFLFGALHVVIPYTQKGPPAADSMLAAGAGYDRLL